MYLKTPPIFLLICLLTLPAFNMVVGQVPDNRTAIDSIVALCSGSSLIPMHTEEGLVTFSQTTGDGVHVFNPFKDIHVVYELKSNKDTFFVKTFYSLNRQLVYLKEQHIIYSLSSIVDTISNRKFKTGYQSFYYIIDDFYAGGNMTYSYEFRDYDFSPEPITYTSRMIKQNTVYLESQ